MKDRLSNIKNIVLSKTKNANYKSSKTWVFISIFLLAIVSVTMLSSYGYYHTSSNNLVLSSTVFVSDGDVILKIYLEDRDEDGDGLNTYSRNYFLPSNHYTYNSSISYCTGDVSIISYDSTNRILAISSAVDSVSVNNGQVTYSDGSVVQIGYQYGGYFIKGDGDFCDPYCSVAPDGKLSNGSHTFYETYPELCEIDSLPIPYGSICPH